MPRRPWLSRVVLVLPLLASSPALASHVTLVPAPQRPAETALRRSTRQLPRLEERWRCECHPKNAVVDDGVVYVLGYHRLFAVRATDGALVWDGGPETATAPHGAEPVLTEDRVAAVFGSEVVLRDRATGLEIARVDLEQRVEELTGPPLVASLWRPGDNQTRELVRIDAASGQILSRRDLGTSPRLQRSQGHLYATRYQGDESFLTRLDSETLATLDQWAAPGGYPASDLRFIQHRGKPADQERPGALGFEVTTFDPASEAWHAIEVESDGGVQATDTPGFAHLQGRDGQPRGLLRYEPSTGRVLWERPLLCRPGPLLMTRNHLVAPCGWESGGAGLFLFLDPRTGDVLETLEGPERLRSIVTVADDLWIVATDEAIVAFDPSARAPSRASSVPLVEAIDRILDGIYPSSPTVDSSDVEALLSLGPEALPLLSDRLPAGALARSMALATALGGAEYRPAAPKVAALLDDLPPPEDRSSWRREAIAHPPERRLLEILATIGGPEQASSAGRILLDPKQPWLIRREAAFTLAAIADPPSLEWLDRFAHQLPPGRSGGEPAHPPEPRATASPRSDEEAIRDAIRQHLSWFGQGDGPLSLCPPGSPGPASREETAVASCRRVTIEEVDAVDGARAVADLLPLREGERRYVVRFGDPPWDEKSFYRVRRVGERWVVRSVWDWVR